MCIFVIHHNEPVTTVLIELSVGQHEYWRIILALHEFDDGNAKTLNEYSKIDC